MNAPLSDLLLNSVSRTFGSQRAVENVSVHIHAGEFFSILGPSGCGKTTLLRMIAGFDIPTSGSIHLAGRDITRMPAQQRKIGLVFQNYALFPHMTVFDNVAFGLEIQKVPGREITQRVRRVLDAVKLLHKERASVTTLSGGEQQRVAVARAIVVEPAVLLFDEPLSNLDVALRAKTREEIRSLQRKIGVTTVYVTHDQSEAMSLSDRLAVMNNGRLEQTGSPIELYMRPSSPFVAGFLGGANLFTADVLDAHTVRIADTAVTVPEGTLPSGSRRVQLAAKPEAVLLNAGSPDGLVGRVKEIEYLGFTTTVLIAMGDMELRSCVLSSGATSHINVGASIRCSFDWPRCNIFPLE